MTTNKKLDLLGSVMVIDFETRSKSDLKVQGAYKYAEHPTTDILCLAYALNNHKTKQLVPEIPLSVFNENTPQPLWVSERYWERGMLVEAHNVAFERSIWRAVLVKRFGWPDIPDECWRDTMIQCAVCALPLSLGGAGSALQLSVQKDEEGKEAMMKLSKPRLKPTVTNPDHFWEKARVITGRTKPMRTLLEAFDTMYKYNVNDVDAEREIMQVLPPLTETEIYHWKTTERMSSRGVHIDLSEVDSALKIIREYQAFMSFETKRLTDNQVDSLQNVAALKKWLASKGIHTESVDKEHVGLILDKKNLPPIVRQVLEIRQSIGKASTSKLERMREMLCSDKRAHGLFVHHGTTTGRVAARGFQPQNLPRGFLKEAQTEQVFALLRAGGSWKDLVALGEEWIALMKADPKNKDKTDDDYRKYKDPMNLLSSCVRGFIKATPGHTMYSADYSNIEGRVLAWLAGEEWKLQAFRDFDTFKLDENGNKIPDGKGDFFRVGHDLYKLTAAGILHKRPEDVTKDERQGYGKVPELALGYQGSRGAFFNMAKNYGVNLPEDVVDGIVKGWREKHPNIVRLWADVEEASIECVRTGEPQNVGYLKFYLDDIFLCIKLPSGRILRYAYPRLKIIKTPWGADKLALTFMTMKKPQNAKKEVYHEEDDEVGDAKWIRVSSYGGSLVENVTQAVARDVMMEAHARLENEYNYNVIMTVHDEIVAEKESGGDLDEFCRLMAQLPSWCPDLPVAVAGWEGLRYKKDD